MTGTTDRVALRMLMRLPFLGWKCRSFEKAKPIFGVGWVTDLFVAAGWPR